MGLYIVYSFWGEAWAMKPISYLTSHFDFKFDKNQTHF